MSLPSSSLGTAGSLAQQIYRDVCGPIREVGSGEAQTRGLEGGLLGMLSKPYR